MSAALDCCKKGDGPRCTKAKCKSCCKSFTAFLFSTLGLVILVGGYAILGGFLFREIEEHIEYKNVLESRAIVEVSTEEHILSLWEALLDQDSLCKTKFSIAARQVLLSYQKEVYNATVVKTWDGREVHQDVDTKWNFAGALLYSITAMTTVGYGHVTPKTYWGMWSTMIYCVFGLPLTLVCIANLGKYFARVFRILYHTCCCGICCICCLAHKKKIVMRLGVDGKKVITETDDLEAQVEEQPPGAVNGGADVDDAKPKSRKPFSRVQLWLSSIKEKFNQSVRDEVTLPVYLCLVVMAAYILAGALLFSLWDRWTYIEGAYFCFVTLTTIGFGDYVPGLAGRYTDESGTARIILCSLYLFVGLSLVGMCINLMQEDVIQKMKWMAQKIGLVEDERMLLPPLQANNNFSSMALRKTSKVGPYLGTVDEKTEANKTKIKKRLEYNGYDSDTMLVGTAVARGDHYGMS